MANVIKHTQDPTESYPGATRSGEWLILNDVGKGPTSSTGWWSTNGIPAGGGALYTPGPTAFEWASGGKMEMISKVDNRDPKRNSARGAWVAMVTESQVEYIIPFPGTSIFDNGSKILNNTTTPQRGQISVTAGHLYTADKPVVFSEEDGNHKMVPLSLKNKKFANYSSRYGNSTYYIYNTGTEDARVEVYYGTGGLNGSVLDTVNVPAGQIATYTGTNDTGWYWFYSPIEEVVMSVTEVSDGDRHILAPPAHYIYTRRGSYDTTMIGSAPQSQGTYHNYDPEGCISVEIADGNGGDSTQHLGLEHLSNTYAFGMALSDYHITSPFNNTIEVYYANADSNNGWVLLNSHTLTGSLLSPGQLGRDGSGGSYDDSGNANYFAGGAQMFLFKGTAPFKLTVNDTANDEETLFGWMENENSIIFPDENTLDSYIVSRPDWLIQ